MVTDPIADMLTRIRNAIMAHHDSVQMPASRIKLSIAKILKDEGFVTDYTVLKGKPQRIIKISLKYINGRPAIAGLERASKPGLKTICWRSGNSPRLWWAWHRYFVNVQRCYVRSRGMA